MVDGSCYARSTGSTAPQPAAKRWFFSATATSKQLSEESTITCTWRVRQKVNVDRSGGLSKGKGGWFGP